jgi:hypothetical protein
MGCIPSFTVGVRLQNESKLTTETNDPKESQKLR